MTENKYYPFDADSITVSINARPGADTPLIVSHKLRRPTLMELIERDKNVNLEIVETNPREEQLVTDDEAANCRLWDKLILEVKGYKGGADWRPLTDDEKAVMRSSHKTMALRAAYAGGASVVGNDGDEISLAADSWTIKHYIGDEEVPQFVILHTLREPTESERTAFKRAASRVSFIRGSKKARTRIGQDLNAYVKMYDALIESIDGATVRGEQLNTQNRVAFLMAIDPTWKRLIIQTLMSATEASLLD